MSKQVGLIRIFLPKIYILLIELCRVVLALFSKLCYCCSSVFRDIYPAAVDGAARKRAAASKRPNGWELLYTERSPAVMTGTAHHKNIIAEAIPLSDLPALKTPAAGMRFLVMCRLISNPSLVCCVDGYHSGWAQARLRAVR